MTWCLDQFVTLHSNAQGTAGAFISANPGGNVTVVSAFTGATPTATGGNAPAPGWAPFATALAQWRCVSLGIEVNGITSSMNNSGEIGIAVVAPAPLKGVVSNYDFNAPSTFVENERNGLSQGKTMCAIMRNAGVQAREFKPSGAASSPDFNSDGYEVLYVYCTGVAPSTGAVAIRIRAHYELVFSTGSLFNQMSSPSAVEDPLVTAGKNYVTSAIGAVFTGGAKQFENIVRSAATDYIQRKIARDIDDL